MTLKEYARKRDFGKTPEPAPGVEPRKDRLSFVVQKHSASHLHYDLRLEAGGSLKSWAVPKGPSLNPADSRLAMMVEDHPLEYGDFEGTIPPGNYGAGTVMVWDRGTYAPAHSDGDPGKAVEDGIRRGKLAFILDGKKLKGEFYLVRMKRRGENAWLLKKKDDRFASAKDVEADDISVKSGRNLREIAVPREYTPVETPSFSAGDLAGAPRAPMPREVKPMLATLVDEPFSRDGWLFEIKWDGYRAIAELDRGHVRLYSRNGKDLRGRFPSIARSLTRFRLQAVLDGEITAVDHEGKADFQLLQNYLRTGKGILAYFVFDLLYLQGHDLREFPLKRRKALLHRLFSPHLPDIKLSVYVENDGLGLFRFVVEHGIEGMVAKDGASVYQEGARGASWLKVKAAHRQEAVIGGFTAPKGGRRGFGSLLLGVYDARHSLVYIGHSGGGFGDRELQSIHEKLARHVSRRSPFANFRSARGVKWVRPRLVCEVRFTEWTREGLMRHPVFLGLRPDKDPAEVSREEPSAARKYFPPAREGAKEETLNIGSRELRVTNLTKVFWPDEGYTKRDLIAYYREVAPVMLPYLLDRAQSLHRFPDGIYGKSFFHKDVGEIVPGWMKTFSVSEPDGGKVTYMVCEDEASLVFMVNLGCIEINPWNSRVQKPGYPDYMVFDFDPLDVPFSLVVEAVLETRAVLERIGCESFCKTSGSKGMHVYVPLNARYTYAQVRDFAELVNRYVNSRLPLTTSIDRLPRKREGRVYLDFLQNAEGKTMAAPYSVRPRPKATVSCPLEWKEVTRGLDPAAFTIRSMPARIRERGDPWKGMTGKSADLLASLERLSSLYKGGG